MKTGDLAKLFGVSPTTVQNWSKEFAEFLSQGANKASSKQRLYTEDDILVLATIAKLSVDGLNYDAIQDRLQSGERVEHPGVANYGVDTRMVPAAAVEQIIDSTELRTELEMTKARLEFLQAELGKRDEKLVEKDEAIAALHREIADLRERAGKAEGELELRRQQEQEQKKRRWWG